MKRAIDAAAWLIVASVGAFFVWLFLVLFIILGDTFL